MKRISYALSALTAAVAVLAFGVVSATAGSPASAPAGSPPAHAAQAQSLTQSDLRALLGRQFGEHAALAMNATNLGVIGSPAFPAAAKALDATRSHSRGRSPPCTARRRGRRFWNGKFMWRDHIGFFAEYTTAVAKNDMAGQEKAVANLKRYTVVLGSSWRRDGPAEAGRAARPARARARAQEPARRVRGQAVRESGEDYSAAYAHMFMTADLLAGAIAKQKNLPK